MNDNNNDFELDNQEKASLEERNTIDPDLEAMDNTPTFPETSTDSYTFSQDNEEVKTESEKTKTDGSSTPPPNFPFTTYTNQKSSKKRPSWLIPVLCVVAALAIVVSAIAFVASQFDIVISNDNGFSISLRQRGFSSSSTPTQTPSTVPSSDPVTTTTPTVIPTSSVVISPVDSAKTNTDIVIDGTTKYNISQISTQLSKATVYIACSYSDGALGSGSGAIFTEDGYIVTNHHVTSGASQITVTLNDGTSYPAAIVGSDSVTDLSVIKIDAKDLYYAKFGDSDKLSVGETVVVIGSPLGINYLNTVTSGIVSGINRSVSIDNVTMSLIQTNAEINSGNSGGPMINEYGLIVGIVNSKISGSYFSSVEGIGFAIPSSTAVSIINQLLEKGYVAGRPALGISVREVSAQMAAYYGMKEGLYVIDIEENCDAYKRGVKMGDIIIAFNGEPCTTSQALNKIRDNFVAGDTVTITVFRSGDTLDISFKLEDYALIYKDKQ